MIESGLVQQLVRASLCALLAAPLVFLGAGTALADEKRGSCSDGDFSTNYGVIYNTVNGNHLVTDIWWDINIGAATNGTHNNVEARIKHDNSLGNDKIYYTYISSDDIPSGPGGGISFKKPIVVPEDQRMYVEFKFVFDVPEDADARCEGTTSRA